MGLRALLYVEGEWDPSLFCQEEESAVPIYKIPIAAGRMSKSAHELLAGAERLPKSVYGPPAAAKKPITFNHTIPAAEARERWGEGVTSKEKNRQEKAVIPQPRELLMIAATDQTVQVAKQLGIAVAGYVNPLFPRQTFAGVPMVIEGFEEVDLEFLDRIYRRCHGLPWGIAVTERCLIREMTLEDLDDLIQLYQQPGITWRLDEKGNRIPGFIEPLYPREEEKTYQQAYISNMYGYYGYGMWAVVDRESGKLIGRAGLDHREYDFKVELEMGYLIDPKYQHRGIATEVCQAILDFARENLDFSRINALTDPQNFASEALLKRLGFVYLEDFPVAGKPMRRYTFHF